MRPSDIIFHELIGLKVAVVWSKNKCNIGIEGEVIDETQNTLVIRTAKGIKRIIKEICTFLFTLPDGTKVLVPGYLIAKRPEERVKMKVKAVKRWLRKEELETLGLKV